MVSVSFHWQRIRGSIRSAPIAFWRSLGLRDRFQAIVLTYGSGLVQPGGREGAATGP
ncbi:MAG: hypothetical protein H0V03_12845 [Thermoleophilaceae bacterium]|nr:hypothetical protein [Thermoleophilaceae bacterium]